MITKNCRKIIKAIYDSGARYKHYSVRDLMDMTGLPAETVCAACENLASCGLMEIQYFANLSAPRINYVQLTELGAHQGEVKWASIKQYILDHWIALLALAVSVVSLVISIRGGLN